MDWGLAKVWRHDEQGHTESEPKKVTSDEPVDTSMTGLGGLEGTVTYMSPEQLRMEPDIDGRSDLFSLGVVLYEVICGVTPAEAETVREMQEKVLTETPIPPNLRMDQRVPHLLNDIVMQCLAKNRDDRPDDCLDVVRLLQEAL